jgi:hypothetical protein
MIVRVFCLGCFVVLLLALAAQAQPPVMSILDLYAELPGIVGSMVRVEGFYHSPEYPVLGLSQEMFLVRIEPEPNAIVELRGALPSTPFSFVTVTGIVDTIPLATPLWGVTYRARITISAYEMGEHLGNPLHDGEDLRPLEGLGLTVPADDCTFALLLCSDDRDPGMWQDMVNYWNYATGHLGIATGNIYAFYHDGVSKNPAQIPSSELRPATHNGIRDGFRELAGRIAACERQGKDATLYKLVTDHGSGYHTGSGPGGPQNWSDGHRGGHIDQGGDESDLVPETQLKFDYAGPAPGWQYQFDLDGDGTPETFLRNNGGVKELWVVNAAGNTVLAGRDINGDGSIDAADGGIDLNGDGDLGDSFAWDEDLALSNDTRDIQDDEWASWQKMLSDSCLDNLHELIDCCFSGGFKKDEQDSIPCKTAVLKAMASAEGEYSYGSTEGVFAGPFIRGLVDSGWTWDEAFRRVTSDTNVTRWETPQWWSKTHGCEGIDLGIEDIPVSPGENVFVPVYIQDVTGWGIYGFEIEICWCGTPAGLLQYEYCVPGEVMTGSGWSDPMCNPCGAGCVDVAAAGAGPLEGGGVLFYLKFHVSTNAKPCMCCDLWFTFANLYDPEEALEVCLTGGSVCVDWCTVPGSVRYWKCCQDECGDWYLPEALAGVRVHLFDCDGPIASRYTGEDGAYEFACLAPVSETCPYCMDVDYCDTYGECITAYDASLILRHLVCLDDLDDCVFPSVRLVYPQRVAADANCSGQITAYDASLVLQYVVGLIDLFPCGDEWLFFPYDAGACVYACPEALDWVGVRIGDVSGCTECPQGGPALLAASQATVVRLGRATRSGDMVEMPVLVRGAAGIQSVEFDLSYNAEALRVLSVDPVGLASDFMTFSSAAEGRLAVAMAGMTAFEGSGRIAVVRFERLRRAVLMAGDGIWIERVLFNEGVPRAVIEGAEGEFIERFALGPAAPNPFVGGTEIGFAVPARGRVTVAVYDVTGRLVATLVDGVVPAGRRSVSWDGTDAEGNKAANGVYFCRMQTESFRASEKLVLLR